LDSVIAFAKLTKIGKNTVRRYIYFYNEYVDMLVVGSRAGFIESRYRSGSSILSESGFNPESGF
jgi:hypothetical protein